MVSQSWRYGLGMTFEGGANAGDSCPPYNVDLVTLVLAAYPPNARHQIVLWLSVRWLVTAANYDIGRVGIGLGEVGLWGARVAPADRPR